MSGIDGVRRLEDERVPGQDRAGVSKRTTGDDGEISVSREVAGSVDRSRRQADIGGGNDGTEKLVVDSTGCLDDYGRTVDRCRCGRSRSRIGKTAASEDRWRLRRF